MNETEIKNKLKQAIDALFSSQPNIFEFTSETSQTEWNLAHHLAVEAHRLFHDYDCDLDIVKLNLKRRRPDIIFHKRGDGDHNLLVIEVKRDGYPSDIKKDIDKIESVWFMHPLHYQYGAVINLRSDRTYEIATFRNVGRAAQPA